MFFHGGIFRKLVSIQERVMMARVRYLITSFLVCLPEENNNKYLKFEIRHVQIDELPRTKQVKTNVLA